MDFIKIRSSSPFGDAISLIPSLKELSVMSKKKIIFYQALDVVAQGVHGVSQPFVNEQGDSIMFGIETFKMAKPLFEKQLFIESFEIYTGQEINFDFDEIRLKTFTNQPHGNLASWPPLVFPECACDLSKRYIDVFDLVEGYENKAIINFTPRYRNAFVQYWFLKQYESSLIFSGLPDEHSFFCKKWNLDIPLLKIDDFYHLACILNSCKFILSNQSSHFQLAEGLKIKRILELCQYMPNVIPMGADAYTFYHQNALEFYFNRLINS